MNKLIILLLLIILLIYFYSNKQNKQNEYMGNFQPVYQFDQCLQYGDDYDTCYANPQCTIWFKPDGSTYCRKKFIHEDI